MKPQKALSRRARIWRIFWMVLICLAIVPAIGLESYRSVKVFRHWNRNRLIKQTCIQELDSLRLEQQKLKDEVYKLKYNTLAQERVAREMGYVRPGEVVYRFIPKN